MSSSSPYSSCRLPPVLPRLTHFTLYETRTRFFLVGSVGPSNPAYQILKISRFPADPPQVEFDPNVYDQDSLDSILSMTSAQRVCQANGVIGMVRFVCGYYLLLSTGAEHVASLGPHSIYQITDSQLIYIPNPLLETPIQSSQAKLEQKYKSLFQMVEISKNFYYSYSYPLSQTLQHCMIHSSHQNAKAKLSNNEDKDKEENQDQHQSKGDMDTSPSSCFPSIEPRSHYIWNQYLLAPFLALSPLAKEWTIELIHGYVEQSNFSVFGRVLSLTLISRRSRLFAGTRYLKRGVNESGCAANEVETEQIVADQSTQTPERFHASSHIQLRGSIPVHWSQEGSAVVAQPAIVLQKSDPLHLSTRNHFIQLFERYGTPILVLNLVKQFERRKRECIVGNAFSEAVEFMNSWLPEDAQIDYLAWDFKKVSKSKTLSVVDELAVISHWALQRTGVFHSLPSDSAVSASFEPTSHIKPTRDCLRQFVPNLPERRVEKWEKPPGQGPNGASNGMAYGNQRGAGDYSSSDNRDSMRPSSPNAEDLLSSGSQSNLSSSLGSAPPSQLLASPPPRSTISHSRNPSLTIPNPSFPPSPSPYNLTSPMSQNSTSSSSLFSEPLTPSRAMSQSSFGSSGPSSLLIVPPDNYNPTIESPDAAMSPRYATMPSPSGSASYSFAQSNAFSGPSSPRNSSTPTGSSPPPAVPGVPQIRDIAFIQRGICRSNCIDSLDRTNVAAFCIGKAALGYQLYGMGFLESQQLDPHSPVISNLLDCFERMGDCLALQYGGSQMHRQMKKDRGKTVSMAPVLHRQSQHTKPKEMFVSLMRHYQNSFQDTGKQDAMNLFLGLFQPGMISMNGSPMEIWDMQSDYYLHNPQLCYDAPAGLNAGLQSVVAAFSAAASGFVPGFHSVPPALAPVPTYFPYSLACYSSPFCSTHSNSLPTYLSNDWYRIPIEQYEDSLLIFSRTKWKSLLDPVPCTGNASCTALVQARKIKARERKRSEIKEATEHEHKEPASSTVVDSSSVSVTDSEEKSLLSTADSKAADPSSVVVSSSTASDSPDFHPNTSIPFLPRYFLQSSTILTSFDDLLLSSSSSSAASFIGEKLKIPAVQLNGLKEEKKASSLGERIRQGLRLGKSDGSGGGMAGSGDGFGDEESEREKWMESEGFGSELVDQWNRKKKRPPISQFALQVPKEALSRNWDRPGVNPLLTSPQASSVTMASMEWADEGVDPWSALALPDPSIANSLTAAFEAEAASPRTPSSQPEKSRVDQESERFYLSSLSLLETPESALVPADQVLEAELKMAHFNEEKRKAREISIGKDLEERKSQREIEIQVQKEQQSVVERRLRRAERRKMREIESHKPFDSVNPLSESQLRTITGGLSDSSESELDSDDESASDRDRGSKGSGSSSQPDPIPELVDPGMMSEENICDVDSFAAAREKNMKLVEQMRRIRVSALAEVQKKEKLLFGPISPSVPLWKASIPPNSPRLAAVSAMASASNSFQSLRNDNPALIKSFQSFHDYVSSSKLELNEELLKGNFDASQHSAQENVKIRLVEETNEYEQYISTAVRIQ